MERNQLRYVVETAKTGNITRVAENLYLSQSSLLNRFSGFCSHFPPEYIK